MALQESLDLFLKLNPGVIDVFYATTPPNVLLNYLDRKGLQLGNLKLSRLPHIFISPENVLNQLRSKSYIDQYHAFMESKGNVLLVRKDNPKNISGIQDTLRDDVTLFISNPQTEKASYQVYFDTFQALAEEQGLSWEILSSKLTSRNTGTVFGERIHHREAPQALYDNRADVAMVYYHLALRYTHIFPDEFDIIPLGGSIQQPQPSAANITTTYYVGLMKEPGNWGQQFMEFLFSEQVTDIYHKLGLQRPASNTP